MEIRQVRKLTGGKQGKHQFKFMDILRTYTQVCSFFMIYTIYPKKWRATSLWIY